MNNEFLIHHGEVYQHLNFDDVQLMCYTFLLNDPSEVIVFMVMKEEYKPEGNTETFQ